MGNNGGERGPRSQESLGAQPPQGGFLLFSARGFIPGTSRGARQSRRAPHVSAPARGLLALFSPGIYPRDAQIGFLRVVAPHHFISTRRDSLRFPSLRGLLS